MSAMTQSSVVHCHAEASYPMRWYAMFAAAESSFAMCQKLTCQEGLQDALPATIDLALILGQLLKPADAIGWHLSCASHCHFNDSFKLIAYCVHGINIPHEGIVPIHKLHEGMTCQDSSFLVCMIGM